MNLKESMTKNLVLALITLGFCTQNNAYTYVNSLTVDQQSSLTQLIHNLKPETQNLLRNTLSEAADDPSDPRLHDLDLRSTSVKDSIKKDT